MAWKTIIASNLEQIGEILKHKKTAYLIDPGNMKQLADAMLFLIKDAKQRENLGREARLAVLKNFSWDKHVKRILIKLREIDRYN